MSALTTGVIFKPLFLTFDGGLVDIIYTPNPAIAEYISNVEPETVVLGREKGNIWGHRSGLVYPVNGLEDHQRRPPPVIR